MVKRTVLFALRFEIEMPVNEIHDFVKPLIMAELEGSCKERLHVLKEKLGAIELRVDITAY